MNELKDERMSGGMNRRMNGLMNIWKVEGKMNIRMNGQLNKWMEGGMNGRMNK
jgi:hypothetical protein